MWQKKPCITLVLHINDNSGPKTIQKQSFISHIHEKRKLAPEFLLKTLFKKKPHRRRLLCKSVETSKNTPNIEQPQRQLSTIIRTNNIFCSIKQTANKHKGQPLVVPILAFQAIDFWNYILHWIKKLFSSILKSDFETAVNIRVCKLNIRNILYILVCFHE